MTLTNAEKAEMRQVDDYARRILERTEALPPAHLLRMHGVIRETRLLDADFFNPEKKPAGATGRRSPQAAALHRERSAFPSPVARSCGVRSLKANLRFIDE